MCFFAVLGAKSGDSRKRKKYSYTNCKHKKTEDGLMTNHKYVNNNTKSMKKIIVFINETRNHRKQ